MDTARLTLDSPALRARLRREASIPTYKARPIVRRPVLLSDVLVRPQPAISRQLAPQSQPVTDTLVLQPPHPIATRPTALPQTQPVTESQQASPNFWHRLLHSLKPANKLQAALTSFAILLILVGAYVSLVGFRANHVAVAQATKLTAQANVASGKGATDTSNPAPSTVKPSAKAVAAYTVAPNLPKYLIIPKLGVNARILSVGVTNNGALATPTNVYDTAWYNESVQPGQPGAMLIDGHVSSWTAHGVFYGIKTLTAGDTIKAQRGDNTVFTYKVVKTQVYPAGNVDMTAAMTPIDATKPGLNLITCTGDVIPGTNEFNERVMVFAEQE